MYVKNKFELSDYMAIVRKSRSVAIVPLSAVDSDLSGSIFAPLFSSLTKIGAVSCLGDKRPISNFKWRICRLGSIFLVEEGSSS